FTLVELIVVIAIMAILAGMTVPSVLNYIKSYKKVSAKTDTESIFRIAVAAIPQYLVADRGADDTDTSVMVRKIKERASSSEYEIVAYSSVNLDGSNDKSVILVEVYGSTVYVAFLVKGWKIDGATTLHSASKIVDEDGADSTFLYSQTIWE
ncbi:MAG: prepilin-type N-terminal cleavage/methylation domain-containing protein, partial [Faecalibacterium sp.]|nr:prepilin-type N-terminal cleavage/methylation domain-containing protein [Faecalibacterium sp.]